MQTDGPIGGQVGADQPGGMDWTTGGTYGASALIFCAADFEIGKARYAWVFLEFCAGANVSYGVRPER